MLTKKLLLIIIFLLILPITLAIYFTSLSVDISVKAGEKLIFTVTPDNQGVLREYYIYFGSELKHKGNLPYSENIGYTEETVAYQIPLDWQPGIYSLFVYANSLNDYIQADFKVTQITQITCSDGTSLGQCSIDKPKYCDDSGNLVDNYCYGPDLIVGSVIAVTVDVDGIQGTIPEDDTKIINGIEITVESIFYREKESSAVLIIYEENYFMNVGDSIIIDGKTVTLQAVGPSVDDCGCPPGYECQVDGSCKLVDVCSDELEPISEPVPNETEKKPLSAKTSFALLVNPQNQKSNKLSLYFDGNLSIDTQKLTKQISNVVDYDKNSIVLEFDEKNTEPFMLVKSGEGNIEYMPFEGYIVKLKRKPILEEKKNIEDKIKETKEEIEEIDTSGIKVLYNGPRKFIKEFNVNNLEGNLPESLKEHKRKIEKEQDDVKKDILKIIKASRKQNKITGYAVKTNEELNVRYEFKKTFNGIVLKDIYGKEAKKIEKISGVEKVSPNFRVKTSLIESIPIIKADKLWEDGYTGEGITIAIIDTGIDYTHPDLGGCFGSGCKVIFGYDFVNNDNDPMDDQGHGTHCASIAAGNGALKGVAPNAKLVAYKVLDSGGSGTFAGVIAGIERAVDPNQDGNFEDHVDVISMSLGASCWEYNEYCGPDDDVSKAVDNAVKEGVIAAIAAGNSGPWPGTIGSPGTAREAITVGATDKYNNIAEFSSRGPVEWSGGVLTKPNIVAPGVNICAAQWDSAWDDRKCFDNEHVAISGTSMATPHIAGAAALLLQVNPLWSPEELKSALMMSAEDLGFDANTQGAGLADIQKANKIDFFVSPLSLNFGTIIDKLPQPQKITLINKGTAELNLVLTIDCSVAVLDKTEVVLMPDSSIDIEVSIIDFPQKEGSINGKISIFDGSNIYKIPYSFKVLSELKVFVNSGKSPSYSDVAITNEELSYIDYKFEAENYHAFYVPSGRYTVYAGGDVIDFESVEYLLMEDVDVPKGKRLSLKLDIKNSRPFTIKAKSLDGTNLFLYEWQKAFKVYNYRGCYLTYDFTDPNYGDRTVYVSNKPENNLDVDVFFKYHGIPSKIEPISSGGGWARGFSWRKCD